MAKTTKQTTASAAKKPTADTNKGFTVVSKTTTITMQNDKGVKRVIRETESAPKAKSSKTATKPAAAAKPVVKTTSSKPQTKPKGTPVHKPIARKK